MTQRLVIRRCIGGIGVAVAATMMLVSPALAATRSIEWKNPTVANPVLSQVGKISVMTMNDDGRSTDKIEITVVNPHTKDDPCTPNPLTSTTNPPAGSRGSVPFEADVIFPCNGNYSVEAKAWTTRQGLNSADLWSSSLVMQVAIPPVPVAGLTSPGWVASEDDTNTGQIELKWDPNPEVDLIGYRIDRKVNDQSLETLAEVDANVPTTYVDAELPISEAKYTYRVVALRKGSNADDSIASTTPVVVTIASGKPANGPIEGTPVTTPTTVPSTAVPITKTITPSGSSAASRDSASPNTTADTPNPGVATSRTFEIPAMSTEDPAPASELPAAQDTGYADRLPYSSDGVADEETDDSGEILEELGAGEGTQNRRAVMIPIAAGLILAMSWVFVRLIRSEMAHADAAESLDQFSKAQWTVRSDQDDTGPVLTRSEIQAAKRSVLQMDNHGA